MTTKAQQIEDLQAELDRVTLLLTSQRVATDYWADKYLRLAGTCETVAIADTVSPQSDFEAKLDGKFTEAQDLLVRKHHDYGATNISRSPGGPLNGLRVRMWDKIARINNLTDSGEDPANESLRDSFIDILNYAAIALMVLDGDWPEQ